MVYCSIVMVHQGYSWFRKAELGLELGWSYLVFSVMLTQVLGSLTLGL